MAFNPYLFGNLSAEKYPALNLLTMKYGLVEIDVAIDILLELLFGMEYADDSSCKKGIIPCNATNTNGYINVCIFSIHLTTNTNPSVSRLVLMLITTVNLYTSW